jgi:diamine N-acetyltransferase
MSSINPRIQSLSTTVATDLQLPVVSALAHDIWHLHYPAIIPKAQIDYVLGLRYSQSALKKLYANKNNTLLLAQLGPMAIGYALLRHAEDAPDEMCLDAFYLHPKHHKRGFGTQFMEQVFAQVRLSPRRTLVLNVNRLDIGAINFFFSLGFTIRSVVNVDLGHGYTANDFIMECAVTGHDENPID